ncbi:hypothetical protein QQX98_009954 [Neonectria punicea]|uniref:PD-(D/E)XK nuclease-like domain-containing protein n=1 Tax=Neonectria punicea TaxID=979145 RepID=A0ABR1GQU8_9HYPO
MSAHTDSPEKRPNDETPKASRGNKRVRTPRSESSYSLPPSQSQYYTSTRSGQSSPLRDLAALERDEQGLKPRELSAFHPQPPSLEALLEQIEVFAYAEGILPASARDTLEMLDAAVYWDMRWATQRLRSTRHYSTEQANWSIAVYSRILDLAFDAPDHQARLVKSMGRSTIDPPRTKNVDFCIYFEPSKDASYPEVESDLDRLSKTLRCGAINQTDFYPLRNRPIALSIETKKPGESWEKAKLQLGVWESARWAFLRHLFSKYQDQVAQAEAATGHQGNAPAPSSSLSGLPEFLPGIIVQGHD